MLLAWTGNSEELPRQLSRRIVNIWAQIALVTILLLSGTY